MSHMSYYHRVLGRRCHGTRGFRLNSRKFSVQRLRAKFYYLFRMLSRWRSSYENGLSYLKRNIARNSGKKDSSSRRDLVAPNVYGAEYRLRSFGRSNSFYSEAIADCLEFIKRSSVSGDEEQNSHRL